jgi:hypothetical protein
MSTAFGNLRVPYQHEHSVGSLPGAIASNVVRTEKLSFLDVTAKAEEMVAEVRIRQQAIEVARSTKFWSRRGPGLQSFSKGFLDFLTAFQGVVAFLTQANSPYGNVACAWISWLLHIGRNKQLEEDIITDTIKKSATWLRRLQEIQDNFRDNAEIVSYCQAICEAVIDFMRRAFEYYTKPSYYRLYKAVTSPPQIFTQEFANRLEGLTSDLMRYHGFLLSKEIKRLCGQHEMYIHNKARDRLAYITKTLLLPSEWKLENMTQRCKKSHESISQYVKTSGNWHHKRPLEQANLAMLQNLQVYRDWEADPSSSILILQGENGGTDNPYCCTSWLSPMALQFFEGGTQNSPAQERKIFHSLPNCNVPLGRKHRTSPSTAVLSTLLYQLLELYDGQVWESQKQFLTVDQSRLECEEDLEQRSSLFYDVFENCLKELKTLGCSRLYVVLDQLGQLDEAITQDLFQTLGQLVLGSGIPKVTIKVLIIANGCRRKWRGPQMELNVSRKQASHVYVKLDWQQQERDTDEMGWAIN